MHSQKISELCSYFLSGLNSLWRKKRLNRERSSHRYPEFISKVTGITRTLPRSKASFRYLRVEITIIRRQMPFRRLLFVLYHLQFSRFLRPYLIEPTNLKPISRKKKIHYLASFHKITQPTAREFLPVELVL